MKLRIDDDSSPSLNLIWPGIALTTIQQQYAPWKSVA